MEMGIFIDTGSYFKYIVIPYFTTVTVHVQIYKFCMSYQNQVQPLYPKKKKKEYPAYNEFAYYYKCMLSNHHLYVLI